MIKYYIFIVYCKLRNSHELAPYSMRRSLPVFNLSKFARYLSSMIKVDLSSSASITSSVTALIRYYTFRYQHRQELSNH